MGFEALSFRYCIDSQEFFWRKQYNLTCEICPFSNARIFNSLFFISVIINNKYKCAILCPQVTVTISGMGCNN